MRRIAIALLALGAGAFGVAQAGAAPNCTTTAKADGAWGAAATWDNGVPATGVDACIPAGRVVTLASETMAGPGTTTVMDGGRLLVTGYPTLTEGRVLEIEPTGRLELATDNRYVSRAEALGRQGVEKAAGMLNVLGRPDAELTSLVKPRRP